MNLLSKAWLLHQWRELVIDRGRILLVILGVMWGTLSITVVLAFGQGFHGAMSRAILASGHNLIRITSGMTTRPHDGVPAGRWIRLLPEDAVRLQQQVPAVREVSLEYAGGGDAMEYQGRRTLGRAHGVSACYGELRSMWPEAGGRFLNEQDVIERRRVIFLGSDVKQRLFDKQPAVGEVIRLWGVPFLVVGVLVPKTTMGNYQGVDSEKVFIPASTFQALRGWRYPSLLIVGLHEKVDDQRAAHDLYQALGSWHHFDPEDQAALNVWNQVEQDRRTLAIINGTQILMGIVGVLGLSVALIGVANVMFVLVEERQREIGIQMALGARPGMLLGGFFFEGLLLTFIGGILGLLASAGILWVFNQLPLGDTARGYLGHPTVSFVTATIVTVFLGIAGCAAGFFPARRAARMDPVLALREE